MLKSELRKIYLVKQKSLSGAERNERSAKIADGFFKYFNLETIHFLHAFLPIEKNKEIETSFIINRVWENFSHIQMIVSRINFQTMTLENLKFAPDTKLTANKWNILEPTESELVEIEKIDAILIPLLCFDERGFRAGYGKGFYDKFLSECRADCLKIGLSYFPPIAEISDAQSFDVKLDFCVTPEILFTT